MKLFKSHFWYDKRQRNGIFFLLLLIVGFQYIYFYYDFSSNEILEEDNKAELTFFQNKLDSLRLAKIEGRKPKIYPFNPSFITDYKGAKLGMSNKEIDRLLAYRSKGNYINSIEHFQRVTKVSDSLLAVISPYFKFPDWLVEKKESKGAKRKNINTTQAKSLIAIQDLNTATANELMKIKGIGPALSERIVKYRSSIQGFTVEDQIQEVYGLNPEIIDLILERFKILTTPIIEKLNVNTATFKEVLHLPYIDYELTKKIFQYRDEIAEFQSIEELKNIEGFPMDKFDRITVYLTAK
ncbi:MAG: helix-hairpin-helix domain-containing protein [Flavobacteriaceae bacterium]|nr:helix-hairpin-helix domain-containing protein [Flavobacteriaceae bacterium]